MIQKTLWSPDTCGCQIEYEWDDSVSLDAVTPTVSRIVKICPAHSHHSDKVSHYSDVLGENQSKNKAIGLLLKHRPELKDSPDDVNWKVNADRSISISFKDSKKTDIDFLNGLSKEGISHEIRYE